MSDWRPALAALLALLLATGLLALWWSRRRLLASGLPRGRVISVDMADWQRTSAPLYSPHYRLTGRPDYVVAQGKRRIPVEVKPTRTADEPYASDIMQLAAYCLLLEEEGARPAYGLVRYASQTFRVPYTSRLRATLLRSLSEMRRQIDARDVRPNHRDPRRCVHCGYRDACRHRLA